MSRRRLLALFGLLLSVFAMPIGAAEPTSRPPILLVASEELEDSNFSGAVVLVVFPAGGQPTGVILNKPSELAVKDAFPEDKHLRTHAEKVFFGGPVRMDVLTYLVRSTKSPREGYKLLDNLFLTQDAGYLDALLAKRGKVDRFFLGTAVWMQEQLDAEIEAHQWFVLPVDLDSILNAHPETLWRNLLAKATAVET